MASQKEENAKQLLHELAKSISTLIFGSFEEVGEVTFEDKEAEEKYNKYITLAEEGKINEAENALYGDRDLENQEDLRMALRFFDYINQYTNEYLEKCDYSRVEIKDGMDSVLQEFGYNGFDGIDALDEYF